MIDILKDIWRNFKTPLLLGVLGVLIVTTYVYTFDYIWQYYLCVALCSAGGVASIVYGLKKLLK